MFTKVPVDVIQYIALMTDSTNDYLNIALTCKHFSGILSNTQEHPRRAKAQRHFTKMTIDWVGTKNWKLNGQLHRLDDKPAQIWDDGTKIWFKHGVRHRLNDRPAVINNNGFRSWWVDGKRHRDNDKPAVIHSADGTKTWYTYDKKMKQIKKL